MACVVRNVQANGIREQQPRCSALTKAGDPCRSLALTDVPYCEAHASLLRVLGDYDAGPEERGDAFQHLARLHRIEDLMELPIYGD